MSTIRLDHKSVSVKVSEHEIQNRIVYEFFNKQKAEEYDELFERAIYIGVLALMEDRIAAFLSRTKNELGTELESLKILFDLKQDEFTRSTQKGAIAEREIADFLNDWFTSKKLEDSAEVTGEHAGSLPRNKTGDIVCQLPEGKRIAIECKFSKSLKLGDISEKDIYRGGDTAWSQLLESTVNRDAQVSLIVFDRGVVDSKLEKMVENVAFIPEVGFLVIIDSQSGDFTNLAIAYSLARDIALNAKQRELENDTLRLLVQRLIKDMQDILSIKSMVQKNIDNNQKILEQMNKSLLSVEFSFEYFSKFLEEGILTSKDLFDFYQGLDAKEKYKALEKELKEL